MAADVITRFKLETTQFDSKLRDTAKELQGIARQAEKAGKDFAGFDKGAVEAARALGTVASGATNTKDKLKDLVGSFNDAAKAYNSLSEEAKKGEFGKAMAASLQKLQLDIKQTKEELYGLSGKSGGLFSGMGDKMSGALQVFAGNMLTKAAGAVANLGSEMYDMVQQGVELAKQGEGIRIAFERLGRGDLLDGLREATHGTVTDLELMKAAVKFNDFKLPLDQLGTMLAFAQQKAKDTGQSVDYMVESITNGLGRQSKPILDNLGISAKEIEERMKSTGDFTNAVGEIIRDQMSKAGDYVETAADRATQADVKLKNAMEDLGRTFQPLTDASNGLWNSIKVGALNALNTAVKPLIQALAEAGTLGQGARSSAGFNNLGGNSKVDRMIGRLGNGKSAGAYSIYQQQLGEFDKFINNKRFQIAAYGGDNSSVAQSAKARLQTELDGALKMRAEYVKRAQELHNQVPSPFEPASTSGGGRGGKGGSGDKGGPSMPKNVRWDNYIDKVNLGADALKGGDIKETMSVWSTVSDEAKKSMLGLTAATEDLGDAQAKMWDKWIKSDIQSKLEQQNKLLQEQQTRYTLAGQAASNFGAALAGLDDPAAKAAGTVMQAIASIAMGFAMASSNANTAGTGWGWLAWLAAGTAAMATTISTIHSLTGYAQGGIVKGNSYSGDNMMFGGDGLYGLNAGEVVLTKAQQSNLANSLEGGSTRTIHVVGKISGTDILLSADRELKLRGKELAVWGRG